ncbi:efflux RND transporter permease subunit [Bacillus pinisoli]|uniref:efflux RND transporter permease subunit n=1 Tax=Bacillus pinisoli TaxID=2901866 RepID=UPI001FF6960F|nr:efflux RND transporter permease subunit [Bacillus pinisoli]
MNLSKLAVLRPIAMSMVVLLLLILGVVSVKNMTIDLFPELTFPVAAVTATYDGAGPEEIENLLAEPLENAMGTIPNVETISSFSQNGGVLVVVSFNWGTNMDFAALDMREKIDAVREFLPAGVEAPRVVRFDPSDLPIIQLAVKDVSNELVKAKQLAEDEIKPLLDSIGGVASVSIEGGVENEVRLIVDPKELATYNVTIEQLQQLIGSENLNLPAGSITDQSQQLPIRVTGQFQSVSDIESLPIPTSNGILPLQQLVKVEESFKPSTQLSFLNGEPSVGISILKQSGTNTVSVAEEIHKRIDEIKNQLPEGIEIQTVFDQSKFINQSISAVTSNMIIGSILAAIILYVFLRNWRSTLIIGFSIPISIVTTFIFMYFSGYTLNLITMGGLALGIGMMVDNAIVILENIYRLRQTGQSMKDAAIQGTMEVGPAIIASTLTTIIVFLPIIFVEGLAAQLFKPLAIVVSFSLFASLFTALIIVPLFSSLFLKIKSTNEEQVGRFSVLATQYKRLLERTLHHPKKTIIITLSCVIISLAGTPFIGTEYLPAQDQSYINMTVKLPEGRSLDATYEVTERIDQLLEDIEEIDLTFVTVGGGNNFSVVAGTRTNQANYNILLVPKNERNYSDQEIAEQIRTRVSDLPYAKVSVEASDGGFSDDPVSLTISGPNIDVLQELANDTVDLISKVEGVREPTTNYTEGNPQISVIINREAASQYGIGSAQIASAVTNATKGVVASRLARNGEELDIRLTLEDTYTSSIESLSELLLSTPTGQKIPLHVVAEVIRDQGPSQITRTDRIREITVRASILNRSLGDVTKDIEETLKENIIFPSNQYKISFGGQDEQMNDAFFKLSLALALAVVLVYMVMAGQFESFLYPFIIMFAVPLAVIGVILGLLITNQPFGVGSLVGMLILAGIVVNNAIVLVETINLQKKNGMATFEAILSAAPTRLRPIFMTTLTTILGLIPLTLGFGEGTEIQQPMAIVIVFGLSIATFITLLFIPVVYLTFDRQKSKRRKQRDIAVD